ncbi:MAG: hypothetical protein HKM06_04800 [Spirochaetales bacterium]|nr:hypothetical protein [Spirochaetales bacterium]
MKRFLATVVFCLLASGAFAGSTSALQFSIRFYDKTFYTTNPDLPITLQVSLRNTGTVPVWFSMPNQPVFQLVFHVMAADRTGLYLANSQKFNENRYNNQPIFFRNITIQPGEEFAYLVNLRDFVDLNKSGVYTVQAEFHPSLLPEYQSYSQQTQPTADATPGGPSEDILTSNVLTLAVRPTLPDSALATYQENMDTERQEILRREDKSPDNVVRYLLEARQANNEARFFLYLSLEDLYKRSPLYRRTFLGASAEERSRILKDFKHDLWRRETALSKVPSAFAILSTSYTDTEATVTARLKFDAGDYFEIREYTYALHKRNGYWEIYDYQVRNEGTERKGSL